MSIMKKTVSGGLVLATLAGTLAITAPAAEARDRYHHHSNDVWAGAAAGLAGGLIGGALIAGAQRPVYAEPEYAPPPPPPAYYRSGYTAYRPAYYVAPPQPRCHFEWVENEYGDAYRARVCY
ncbi:hypothetical protein EPK99_09130 [Neorhizobium lilium]|uniref:Lectin-like protein BA14k n=1 Tax=Neorhizobium lilium TaxID=2503024 RepID=A0A3S4UQH5_9HYPH|nr:hypothetical protein [Neorhizobium lilium]RWX78743.1 hypothetical protein EPK99_09130 [Neorhizobium lilium]